METQGPSVLEIDADLALLAHVRDFVGESAAALGFNNTQTYDLQLAVDEAVTNVILHGYGGSPGRIAVETECGEASLTVRIRDQARLFDPTKVAPADPSIPPEARKAEGGFGCYLMRRAVDSMFYRVSECGGNELTLVKQKAG